MVKDSVEVRASKGILTAAFFITASTMGAGVLALPVMAGLAGFPLGILGIVLGWMIMVFTGLVLSRQEILGAENADLPMLYHSYFGQFGKILAVGVYLFLFYGLLVAYLSGIDTIAEVFARSHHLHVTIINCCLVGLISIICLRMHMVNKFVLLLVPMLAISFVILIGNMVGKIVPHRIFHENCIFMITAFPAVICSYGFHNTIPTVYKMLNNDGRRIRRAIFLGTSVPLILNLFLLFIACTTVPVVSGHGSQVSLFFAFQRGLPITDVFARLTSSTTVFFAGIIFTIVAMFISLLVVGMCLLRFIQDIVSKFVRNSREHWLLNSVLAFGVPILITFLAKNIFLKAISIAAGFGAVVIFGFMPCLIAIRQRSEQSRKQSKLIVMVVFMSFVAIFIIELMRSVGLIKLT